MSVKSQKPRPTRPSSVSVRLWELELLNVSIIKVDPLLRTFWSILTNIDSLLLAIGAYSYRLPKKVYNYKDKLELYKQKSVKGNFNNFPEIFSDNNWELKILLDLQTFLLKKL